VEKVFIRVAPIIRLTVSGRAIGTTREHPFYVVGKGWRCAGELQLGDVLASHNSQTGVVEAVVETGEVITVYNLRVADYHTYFVGCKEWGFSVWAHNACQYEAFLDEATGWYRIRDAKTKQVVPWRRLNDPLRFKTLAEAEAEAVRRSAPKFTDHRWGDPTRKPCFPANTMVHTPSGLKAIQSLQDGDSVLAYDEVSRSVAVKQVVACLRNWTQHLVKIVTDEETIHATRNHPFFDPQGNQWISAEHVGVGGQLLSVDHRHHPVVAVEVLAAEESTYNIEVEGLHNYFVGEVGILVHNSGFETTNKTATEIYLVKDPSGKVVYVGRTVNGIDVRFNEHLGDGHPHWKAGYRYERAAGGNWTQYEAAVWEQHFIDAHGGKTVLENKVNAISEESYKQYKQLHDPC
jgi:hypothetical protein